MSDDDRLARELAFHDQRFASDSEMRAASRFYAINRRSDAFFRDVIAALAPERLVLDYGCGEGAYVSIEAAKQGHRVMAFDLSSVALEQARARAEEAQVADRIEFQVMNAEALEYAPETFDFVCGLGVLHHLDIAAGLREITRVMKHDASAAFVEPMGHNPLINAYRNRTPDQRTEDEHPILMDDLPLFSARFDTVRASYFHLLGLLAVPLIGTPLLDPVLNRLDQLDAELLKRPRAQRYAWMLGLELAGPRPDAAVPAAN